MERTLTEIAEALDGELVGDGAVKVAGITGIEEAKSGFLTFAIDKEYLKVAESGDASAIIVTKNLKTSTKPIIKVNNPRYAFAKILELFAPSIEKKYGIHPSCVIGKNAVLSDKITLYPNVVVGENAHIGDNTIVYPNCSIGENAVIGNNTLIYSNVVIYENCSIGNNVIIHGGTVIGSDGFGFAENDGAHTKIPQIGNVVIEDDVELGANVAIDKATTGSTIIGRGTKVDNLVHIAHNVTIGEHSIVIAQVGISGSVNIGKRVKLAGQVGVAGHLEIGENSVVGAKSGVTKSLPPNEYYWGMPAQPMAEEKRQKVSLQKLPEIAKAFPKLLKALERIQGRVVKVEEKIQTQKGD